MFNQNYEVNVVGVLNSGMSVYFWEGISSKMTVYTLSGYLTPNDLISIVLCIKFQCGPVIHQYA